ncbi:MAG: hypothetical protein OHK005_18220 [Candidatus Methylacidiphilales bacterium]
MPTAEDWLDEGNTHLALGDLEEAANAYRKATELDPDHFDAWHALAMALMKLERYEEALAAGQETVRIRPNDQMAYTSLSLVYVRMGKIKEAEEMGAKARIISWGGKVKKEVS